MAWYDEPVGHGYITGYQGAGTDTPHFAYDIETPFHTALTAPTSGTVKTADYQAWGGEIFVQPDDKSLPEWYMYHPDELEVHAGQHITAGQEIALSGGENPGAPGALHPAATQWSTGPHTHLGWFTRWQSTPDGTRPYGPDPANLLALAKGGGGNGVSSMVPANVYAAVEPYAQQYGVPDPVWETIAYVESGLNPAPAPGDNGTSFGLFQLHEGGQFPSAYASNPHALDDPGLNAKYAMPAIGAAWHSLGASFDPASGSWWQNFAAQSGHPGGAAGQTVTDSEASRLESSYSTFANGGSAGAPGAYTPLDFKATQQQCGLNPICWIQAAGAAAGAGAAGASNGVAQGITGWIGAAAGPFLTRVGVGVAGLILIIIGVNEMASTLGSAQIPDLLPAAPADSSSKSSGNSSKSRKKAREKSAPAAPKVDAPGAAGAGGGAEAAELAAVA